MESSPPSGRELGIEGSPCEGMLKSILVLPEIMDQSRPRRFFQRAFYLALALTRHRLELIEVEALSQDTRFRQDVLRLRGKSRKSLSERRSNALRYLQICNLTAFPASL